MNHDEYVVLREGYILEVGADELLRLADEANERYEESEGELVQPEPLPPNMDPDGYHLLRPKSIELDPYGDEAPVVCFEAKIECTSGGPAYVLLDVAFPTAVRLWRSAEL